MKETHYLHAAYLNIEDLRKLSQPGITLQPGPDIWQKIDGCRAFLEEQIANSEQQFYGINTGFGALCDVPISPEEIETLQANLVQSHACGTGDEVPEAIVRLMLLLKIIGLSRGYSGVRSVVVERLILFFNNGVYPVVYQQGSLGASGDLAPLAHLSLPLMGMGNVRIDGTLLSAEKWHKERGLEPLTLQAKEGLALLNGTQFSTAYGLWCLMQAEHLLQLANLCGALSLDAFGGLPAPFEAILHLVRPFEGQQQVAAVIRRWLSGSPIQETPKKYVQDPYAFRCIPQVHGASYTAIQHVKQQLLIEANAVTDNPTIFPEEQVILSGGNFHAQPVALVMDYLAIAVAELGSISERRTFQLISGQRDLPAFLVHRPGLNSGLMIPQYTAASIVSQNKQLCTPASVDSIVSSNGQEDHVSMAANAGTKAYRVVQNVERVLAIEWMTAAQAMEFRRPLKTSSALEDLLSAYREKVPALITDRILHTDIELTIQFLRSHNIFGIEQVEE